MKRAAVRKASRKATGIQYAALPYRLEAGRVEILLITSRETRRWVIPKGWPMKGLAPREVAAAEAAEEAGLIGEAEPDPIGSYRYLKRLAAGEGGGEGDGDEPRPRDTAVQVIVFPFRVAGRHDSWKEQGQRDARWFPAPRAASRVHEPALRRLIRDFGAARSPNPVLRGLRAYRAWRMGRAG
jgi:8-oxo-dGTP pyrophosphatase MutT (NUDIX family)